MRRDFKPLYLYFVNPIQITRKKTYRLITWNRIKFLETNLDSNHERFKLEGYRTKWKFLKIN